MSKAALRSLYLCSRNRGLHSAGRHSFRVFSSTSTSCPPSVFRKRVGIFGSVLAVSFALAANSPIYLDSVAVSDDVVREFPPRCCSPSVNRISVDPDTSITFPKTLHIPSKASLPPFTLVGVGVRTVSFLGIKVYSIGLYADLGNPNLNVRYQHSIEWHGCWMFCPQFPKTATPEEKLDHIVRTTACVLRLSTSPRLGSKYYYILLIPNASPDKVYLVQPPSRWLHESIAKPPYLVQATRFTDP
jgi:Chalcone isomerase like